MIRNADIEKRAAALYDDRLPYHNFDHILQVILAGEEIMEKCRADGVAFDEDAVYYAMLLHDAGFHEDHRALGFESKEAYSAALARRFLEGMPVSQSIIGKVVSAILCTHVDGRCRTVEDRIVRRADISGMASGYDQFRADTVSLKRELEMLSGKPVSWDEWKKRARARINLFLREDTGVVPDDYDSDGKPVFPERVRKNIDAMMADPTLA